VNLVQVDEVDSPEGQTTAEQSRDRGKWSRVDPDRWGNVPGRLAWLMENGRETDLGGPYSPKEVADAINAAKNINGTISAVYVNNILINKAPTPSTRKLELLAQFFGKSLTWFYEERPAEDGDRSAAGPDSRAAAEERLLLAAHALLKNPRIHLLARRAAQVSAAKQQALLDIVTATVLTEGKTPLDAEDDPS
jgi:transcriptional regulator with XRE-family HTH domain